MGLGPRAELLSRWKATSEVTGCFPEWSARIRKRHLAVGAWGMTAGPHGLSLRLMLCLAVLTFDKLCRSMCAFLICQRSGLLYFSAEIIIVFQPQFSLILLIISHLLNEKHVIIYVIKEGEVI